MLHGNVFLGKMFLIVVDAHLKLPEVIAMSSTTSKSIIDVLCSLFSCYGLPEQVVSDNGTQFTSDKFIQFLKLNGIKHIRSSPYHPAFNGLDARFVQIFNCYMKAEMLRAGGEMVVEKWRNGGAVADRAL